MANIDRVAPEAPVAAADITVPTNQNVTVSAVFSEDSAVREYSRDGQNFLTYVNGVVMENNGTVYFRGIDQAGNISEVTSVVVDNIDKIAPEAPVAVADITGPTNQDVTVSAAFSDDSVQKQYSLDNSSWQDYTAGIGFSNNGTVYFRSIDAVGNISEVTEYTVNNIDRVPPEAPAAVADITGPTNQNVTVSAVFSEDSAVREYSLDGQNFLAYGNGVVMENNGTVYFRGTDAAGNISEVTAFDVANIDKIAPVTPSASADITEETKENVTVSAVFSEDSVLKQYSLDGETWQDYSVDGVIIIINGTVYFRGIDAAGNISGVTSVVVDNIDKIAPEAPVAVADITGPTNQDVTVSAAFSDDSVQKQYSLDNSSWQDYTAGIGFSNNGTVYFRSIDAVGNISEVTEYTVNNIDRVPPEAPAAVADITGPTNQNVTVSAVFSEDSAVREYSLDGQNFLAYGNGVVMENNGTVYFRGTDAAGNISEVTAFDVANIDKIAPVTPSASADITEETKENVTVSAVFSEDSVQKQYSYNNADWKDYTSGIVFSRNGTVYFRGIDAAGNISEVTGFTVGNIQSDEYDIGGDQSSSQVVDLSASGKYLLTGTFGSDVTGTVTVMNGGKKAGTGSIKNGELVFNKGKSILLDSGLETVIQVTIKKGADTNYDLHLTAETVFDKADTTDNSFASAKDLGPATAAGQLLVPDGWVGFGDEIDYFTFTLNTAANLSLDCTATDEAKFTLVNAATGKTVANAALKGAGTVSTKAALLEAGTYCLSVQSTNAKKGGAADFTVSVGAGTTFFAHGPDNNDTWETAEPAGEVAAGAQIANGWVGFGDAIDYKLLTLNSAAKLTLDCTATDAVKFTLFNAAGKSVVNTALKGAGAASTKTMLLEAGNYYLAVQSTNAKKGGSADYTVTVNPNTVFFPAGDHTNDTLQDAAAKPAVLEGSEITGWVGFGDAADFIKFQVAEEGQIILSLDDAAEEALKHKEIKLSCLDANGKSVALTAVDDDILSRPQCSTRIIAIPMAIA